MGRAARREVVGAAGLLFGSLLAAAGSLSVRSEPTQAPWMMAGAVVALAGNAILVGARRRGWGAYGFALAAALVGAATLAFAELEMWGLDEAWVSLAGWALAAATALVAAVRELAGRRSPGPAFLAAGWGVAALSQVAWFMTAPTPGAWWVAASFLAFGAVVCWRRALAAPPPVLVDPRPSP